MGLWVQGLCAWHEEGGLAVDQSRVACGWVDSHRVPIPLPSLLYTAHRAVKKRQSSGRCKVQPRYAVEPNRLSHTDAAEYLSLPTLTPCAVLRGPGTGGPLVKKSMAPLWDCRSALKVRLQTTGLGSLYNWPLRTHPSTCASLKIFQTPPNTYKAADMA